MFSVHCSEWRDYRKNSITPIVLLYYYPQIHNVAFHHIIIQSLHCCKLIFGNKTVLKFWPPWLNELQRVFLDTKYHITPHCKRCHPTIVRQCLSIHLFWEQPIPRQAIAHMCVGSLTWHRNFRAEQRYVWRRCLHTCDTVPSYCKWIYRLNILTVQEHCPKVCIPYYHQLRDTAFFLNLTEHQVSWMCRCLPGKVMLSSAQI